MINFCEDRWKRIEEVYGKWWNHTLERPLAGVVVVKDRYTIRPHLPYITQENSLDLTITPEQIVDRFEAEFSRYEFYGDAFPMMNMDMFGPGVAAAFLGARIENPTGRIWFHPPQEKELAEFAFRLDEENIWWKRLQEIYAAANRRFGKNAVMGMTDLGGVIDILSTFRPGEKLLLDLIDCPEDVKRQHHIVAKLWMEAYNKLQQKNVRGYTDWSTVFSKEKSYVIQADFSYMISNAMFEEFILDDLANSCRELPHTLYHLDGAGEIKHLDSLLRIPELDAVQWIPGDGAKPAQEWMDIYARIIRAGKGVQTNWCDFDAFKEIVRGVENPGAVAHPLFYVAEKDKNIALKFLDELKIER